MKKKFMLESDASSVGIGAVLRQEGKPVAYISRCLTKTEKGYSITEREVLAAIWSMEKFRFYLEGNRFDLITDHKAIEEIKRKRDFGSHRIQRWFTRLERFQFDVAYKKGEEIITSDALSRSYENVFQIKCMVNHSVNEIFLIHEKMNHRKSILKDLENRGIKVSKSELEKILQKCETCKMHDKKYFKSLKHVNTEKPGEKFAVDILELTKNNKYILGIDYFSRKLFAKKINTKEPKNILEFIKMVYAELPFKELISDNGREFNNKLLKNWTTEMRINHVFAIPHYHPSNGRIERANRTIRNAFRKTKGSHKRNLNDILNTYNNSYHRAIGMTPNNALNERNFETVKQKSKTYEREFKINPETKKF